MRVDCYNILYTDFGELEGGETFWESDLLYMKLHDSAPWNAVRLDIGRAVNFSDDCRVIKAYTKVVCGD